MSLIPVGETEWCMCEMKRHLLLKECKRECLDNFDKAPVDDNTCPQCNMMFFVDHAQSIKLCRFCGYSAHVLLDTHNFSDRSRYNGNRRHHYNPTEHFSQSLHDFVGSGDRTVPRSVMLFCKAVVGRGPGVTSDGVFKALKSGGYRKYYLHKYDIARRLRGSREFKITSYEIISLQTVYTRYRNEFIPFQQAHCIGTFSKTGKPRLYWPMRYILKRMCDEIGRSDLNVFIRGVCDTHKLSLYDKYWNKLQHFIDSTRPKRNRVDPSLLAKALRPRVLP